MSNGGQNLGEQLLRLDVGGKVFEVSKDTLSRFPKSLLANLCDCTDALTRETPLPIDRRPKGFEVILEIFRQGAFDWADVEGDYTLSELRSDLDFYGLPPWEDLCPRPLGQKFLQGKTELVFFDAMEEMLHQMVDICAADLVKKQADFLLYWGNGQELGVHKFTAREDYEYTWWIRHQPNGGFADAWHFEVEYGSDGQTANPAEEIDLANANNTFRVAFLTPRAQEMLVANLTERGFQAEFRVQSVMCDSRELPGQTVQGNVQLVTIKW